MTANEIRQQFISFFEQKAHTFVPSSPVIPRGDATLLFTNAGMNQFKDVFLGVGSRPYKRAVNSQKCIRVSGKHNDLEEVGVDTYHHTFFEMLGNWSFGDYYKREAIQWAWELLTDVWKLPKERLYATVYEDDDEAEKLWCEVTDIHSSHISRWGKKDNFWEMGDVGPCGPCSEIHFDRGVEFDQNPSAGVNTGSPRFLEIWNLVFIQYNRDSSGELHPLPSKHVDTGMGFERISSILQNVRSNYSIDLFVPLIQKVSELSGMDYYEDDRGIPHRVLADHVRALSFAIADGALPGNEGRGYVLRRLLRRAARYARKLHLERPVLCELVPVLDEAMGDFYPELRVRKEHIIRVIRAEEQNFSKTLDFGIERFETEASKLRKGDTLSGEVVWQLYDTFGFPLDLTELMAREIGLYVDRDGFMRHLEEQRNRGRSASKVQHQETTLNEWIVVQEGIGQFVGFENFTVETDVLRWRLNENTDGTLVLELIVAETPFYAEGGGQVADFGLIQGEGLTAEVFDVRPSELGNIHRCRLLEWTEFVPSKVFCSINETRRLDLMRNHTATHLLNQALREVVGRHIHQAGSLVDPNYLRFDFTHYEKIPWDKVVEIEQWVNDHILKDETVVPSIESMASLRSDIETGKIEAMFDEKYGEMVRVVRIFDHEGKVVSQELCGGTHVQHTSQLGIFVITTETGAAAGVRRIEALTGSKAFEFYRKRNLQFSKMEWLLNSSGSDIVDKLEKTLEEKRQLEKEYQQLEMKWARSKAKELVHEALRIGDVRVVTAEIEGASTETLKVICDIVRSDYEKVVIVLGSSHTGNASFAAAVTDDLLSTHRLKAGEIIKQVAHAAGGGGGGKAHLATAGAKDGTKLHDGLRVVPEVVAAMLG
ncbi:MAG: alanine--tRNA ligase [bacterium]|nr:alanine--tRNA ligase [bacterium]